MKVVIRQNQNSLDDTQKANFVIAVLTLKAAQSDRVDPDVKSIYDEFVAVHRDAMHHDGTNDAHRGPAFFPWHRQFLKGFEEWLQWASQDETMGLPYWDWSSDSFPNFLGGDGSSDPDVLGKVLDGEFAYDKRKEGDPRKWTLYVRTDEEKTPYLRRRFGEITDPPVSTLPTVQNVYDTLNLSPYDVAPWDDTSNAGFRNTAEGFIPDPSGAGMHNRVHLWVGGSMIPMTSPNDPVFFLHHSFVDKLWAIWQSRHPDQDRYLPTEGARKGHNLNDPMPPWTVTPNAVLNHHRLGYRYDTEPYLLSGEELYRTQWVGNSLYYLYYGDDGVLSFIRTSDGQPLWQSSTTPRPRGRCIMRDDGNLVIYHPAAGPYDPNPIWESKTPGHRGAHLGVGSTFRLAWVGLYEPGSGGGRDYYWAITSRP